MGFKDGQNCDFCGRLFVQSCGKSTHMKNCDGKIGTLHQPIENIKNQIKNREKTAQVPTKEVSVTDFINLLYGNV